MSRHPCHARLSAKTAWSPAALTRACAVVFVLAITAISGCDRSPAAPSATGGTPSSSVPIVSRVRIDGPTLVAPGESPRYAAIAEYSDRSAKDVTATALWFPNATSFPIHFTSPGIAAPAQRGEALVVANAGTVGRLNVLVLEPGTFKLSGVVSETLYVAQNFKNTVSVVELSPRLLVRHDRRGDNRAIGVECGHQSTDDHRRVRQLAVRGDRRLCPAGS
jgi:hypothetical protein